MSLQGEAILAGLEPDRVVGREVRVMGRVGSTNDEVRQLAAAGAVEGLVVFAEEQTAGRGRGGARWVSEAGAGLLFSVLLRPGGSAAGWLWLSHAVGVAVCRGIQAACGVKVYLKWPNDVYSAEGRKVAGILVENRVEAGGEGFVVVGVGINVGGAGLGGELEGRAGAVSELGGDGVTREGLAVAVLRAFEGVYEAGRVDLEGLMREAEALSWLAGREIEFLEGGERRRGRWLGLGEGGAMRVGLEGGEVALVVQADEVRAT